MEFKSHGYASKRAWVDLSQYSSYVISFTTQHTDSHEIDLTSGPKNQQFSGISANIYSYQNGFYNMFSRLYGEQRALDADGNPLEAEKIILNWDEAKAANKAIDDALVKKKGEINTATNIDQGTKDSLIKDATDAADAAKNTISQATTADAIKKAQDDGVTNINNVKVPSLDDAKSDAKDAINTALTDKKTAISGTNLTDEEKSTLVGQAQKLADDAINKINQATTNDAVNTAKGTGVENIKNINVPTTSATKDAAKAAIDQAAKTKDDAIDASSLTAEEKDALKKTVAGEVQTAKDNIDGATKDADIKTAQTNGEKAINAVEIPTSSKTKNDANSDLDNTADAAKKAIDETSGLTADQKQKAKDQIDQAVADAKGNINKASDNTGVAGATDAGKLAIDKVSANAAIDGALAEKNNSIEGAPNLTSEEKQAVKDQAQKEADSAKTAISNAKTVTDVESAKNTGVEKINNIKVPPTSATKDAANKDNLPSGSQATDNNDSTNGSNSTTSTQPTVNPSVEDTITKFLMHAAYLYDNQGVRIKKPFIKAYITVVVDKTPVVINGIKYYKVAGKDEYIKSGNFDGTLRVLRHNAFVYNHKGKAVRIKGIKLLLKKWRLVRTYGAPFNINGHQMYRIAKNRYIKVKNFE